jgi:AcrR family transcriptional regulator
MTTLPGRRERKKQATRTALKEAALRLAIRDGVENVTVERIADEADIALRTFFNYFSSKEEAVVATVSSAAEALIAEFRARPRTESVLRAFREAVLVILNESDAANRDYLAVVRLIHRTPSLVPQQLAMLAAQEKALASAIAERVDVPEDSVYPMVCAAAVHAALRIVVNQWLEAGREPSAELLGRQVDLVIAELAAGLDRPCSGDGAGGGADVEAVHG